MGVIRAHFAGACEVCTNNLGSSESGADWMIALSQSLIRGPWFGLVKTDNNLSVYIEFLTAKQETLSGLTLKEISSNLMSTFSWVSRSRGF